MGANPIRKGTTSADVIRMEEAEFIASTRIWRGDECMSPIDGANVGKHKWGNDVDVFVALDYVEDAGGGAGYSPPIPQSDVTNLGTDLTTLQTNITNEATTRAAADLILAAPTVELDTGSTNTAIDPGVGIIRFNHGTIASVTEIAVSDAINGVDKGDLLLGIGGILQLRLVGTTTTIEFRIVSAVHTTWTRYTVVYLKGALPADATVLAMRFLPLPLGTAAGTLAEGNHTHALMPEVYLNGTPQTVHATITGEVNGSGQLIANLSAASGSRPALATAQIIGGGTTEASAPFLAVVSIATLATFTVDFLDLSGSPVGAGGAYFTVIGTKA